MLKSPIVKIFFGLTLSVLGIGFLFESMGQKQEGKKSALADKKAPFFKVRLLDSKEKKNFISFEDFTGKPLVLSFWASWCSVCYQEGFFLEAKKDELMKKFSERTPSFLRIAVSDSFEAAFGYAEESKGKIPLAFDDSGDVSVEYGLTGIPETFFIDSKGLLVYRHRGPLSERVFAEKISQIINEEV